MKKHLTPEEIAATAIMMRSAHKGTILIIEGDTDSRLLTRFFNVDICRILIAFGRDNAIGAMKKLERLGLQDGILSIVDSDFSVINNDQLPSVNIIMTDSHDIETMILYSKALDDVLVECGNHNVLKQINVRDILLNSAMIIGLFRWISSPSKKKLNLIFDEMSFDIFVDKNNLKIDIDSLIIHVKIKSNELNLDEGIIKQDILKLEKEHYDLWHICCGHDMVNLLLIGLINKFGNTRAKTLTLEILDSMLRLAYNSDYFKKTRLYQSITSWETKNIKYKFLN